MRRKTTKHFVGNRDILKVLSVLFKFTVSCRWMIVDVVEKRGASLHTSSSGTGTSCARHDRTSSKKKLTVGALTPYNDDE